jgi:hypothetical protein
LEWLPFGKEFGAFLLLLHMVVVGTCFAFFSYFFFVVLLRGTDNLHVRYQEGKNKKGKGVSSRVQRSSDSAKLPSVCVGSGKKIKYKKMYLFISFLFERERWIFWHTLSWRPF